MAPEDGRKFLKYVGVNKIMLLHMYLYTVPINLLHNYLTSRSTEAQSFPPNNVVPFEVHILPLLINCKATIKLLP